MSWQQWMFNKMAWWSAYFLAVAFVTVEIIYGKKNARRILIYLSEEEESN